MAGEDRANAAAHATVARPADAEHEVVDARGFPVFVDEFRSTVDPSTWVHRAA